MDFPLELLYFIYVSLAVEFDEVGLESNSTRTFRHRIIPPKIVELALVSTLMVRKIYYAQHYICCLTYTCNMILHHALVLF